MRVKPYLVESSPAVLSVGARCVDKGYDFIWEGSKGKVRTSLLRGVRLEVRNYVPTPAVEDVEVPEDVEVFEDAEVPAPADAGDGDHLCKTRLIDGCLQCPRCYQNIGTTTDARIATEVARREAMRPNRDTEDKVAYMVHCVIWPRTTGDKLSKRGTRTSLTAPGRA